MGLNSFELSKKSLAYTLHLKPSTDHCSLNPGTTVRTDQREIIGCDGFVTQVRALTCLAEISPDDLEAMGYHDLVDQVQENLEIWRFLHRLEKLNIPLDYEAFKSQNKQVFYYCISQ